MLDCCVVGFVTFAFFAKISFFFFSSFLLLLFFSSFLLLSSIVVSPSPEPLRKGWLALISGKRTR